MARPTFRKKKTEDNSDLSKFSDDKYYTGSVRKTQLITTFGVGSVVDFKDDTVVIASTDDWDYNPKDAEEVENRQLFNENLSVITGAKYFLMPRTKHSTNSFSREKNIPAYIFPEKQHCSRCGYIYDIHELDIKQRHKCPNCKNNLTASRFIIVCKKGHMDDFPYDWWVHSGGKCSSGNMSPRIKMTNIYNRNDISSLWLECTSCGARRSMMQIFSGSAMREFKCTCNYPHFKNPKIRAEYGCREKVSTRLRSSVGVYYPITKSALLIPPWSKKTVRYIQKYYELLKNIPIEKLSDSIRKGIKDLNLSDEDIMRSWRAVENSANMNDRTEKDVMKDEYDILSNEDNSDNEGFSSYTSHTPEKYIQYIEQVAVVDRLTVTQAFTGFTRITRNESNSVDISQYPKEWYPAVELTGEGIFIRLNKEKVQEWYEKNFHHYKLMQERMNESNFIYEGFSAVYVMLHTFAHLFIREISNICGYSSASICEKIYSDIDAESNEIKMCGILVYVSSSDSDSSLGGLISIAHDSDVMEHILDSMLERAGWCSADPLCISSMQQGYCNLNYSACHDCTLLSETSCERFNIFLDRASIVGLPSNEELGFFV